MLLKRVISILMMVISGVIIITGCYNDKTLIPEAAAVNRTVSYSQDIVPIFSKSCNMSGCHNQGGQIPNLSVTVSYNSLLNGNYIDKSSPANSLLYLKMSGKKGSPMPLTGSNIEYNALVLAWIQQGAKDN